jgi:hypothetical protein
LTVKTSDDAFLAAAVIGGASLLFVIDSVFARSAPTSPQITKPKPKHVSALDALGPLWNDQLLDGFMASFSIGGIRKSDLQGTLAFTDGMYQGHGKLASSAEIIMLMPRYGETINVVGHDEPRPIFHPNTALKIHIFCRSSIFVLQKNSFCALRNFHESMIYS